MKYFRAKARADEDTAVIYTPCDASSRSVCSGLPLEVEGPIATSLVFPKVTTLHDLMSCVTNQLVFSLRAAKVMEPLRLPDEARFITGTVIDDDGKALAGFRCLHFPAFIKILDRTRSKFEPRRSDPYGELKHAVITRSAVGHYDWCLDAFLGNVCSEAVIELVESHRLTGFIFEELESAD